MRPVIKVEQAEEPGLDVVDLIALLCCLLLLFAVARLCLLTFGVTFILHACERILCIDGFANTCHQAFCLEAFVLPTRFEALKLDDTLDDFSPGSQPAVPAPIQAGEHSASDVIFANRVRGGVEFLEDI
ncbi:hypothetical protein D3C81_661070 [compost metagenome]